MPTRVTEFASPGLKTTPSFFTFGVISLISAMCSASGDRSERPVTLAPGLSSEATSCAPSGSVTAVKTIGMSLVAATAACAEGVEIGTMMVAAVADELARDLRRRGRLALRRLVDELDLVALGEAGGGEPFADSVAGGVERGMLDDRRHRHGDVSRKGRCSDHADRERETELAHLIPPWIRPAPRPFARWRGSVGETIFRPESQWREGVPGLSCG